MKDWIPLIDEYYYCTFTSLILCRGFWLIETLQTLLRSHLEVLLLFAVRYVYMLFRCNSLLFDLE